MNPRVAGVSIDDLRRVPLFEDLAAEELQAVADAMRTRTFGAGEAVTVEGEAGDGFFVVESGRAEVTVEGQPQGTLGPGDHFGEIALLMGAGRTATITAAGDLRCHTLAPADFRAVVEGNPSIAWTLLQSMTLRLS